MSEPKQSTSSIGAYLSAFQTNDAAVQQIRLINEQLQRESAVLGVLTAEGQPVNQAWERSGLSFLDFAAVMQDLVERELAIMQGSPGQEVVRRTPTTGP